LDQLAREHRERLAAADEARRQAERNAVEASQQAQMNNQRAAIRLAQLVAEKETAERKRSEAEAIRRELEVRQAQLDRELETATRNSTSQLRRLQQEKEVAVGRSREAEQQLAELVRIERERTAAWELQRGHILPFPSTLYFFRT
jgi:dTDP-4-amino-4,6-dideoxygalactose transaminase